MHSNGANTTSSVRRARIDSYTHFVPPKFLENAAAKEGRPFPREKFFLQKATLVDAKERLWFLDRNEIDLHVLVPLPWLESFPRIGGDRKLAAEAARVMNDELAAVVATAPTRFRAVALLPTIEPDAMVEELYRAVRQLGFVGAVVFVGPALKRLDHPDFDALYKALEELDVTLWLHPSRSPEPEYSDEAEPRFQEWQTIGWLSDTTSAMFRIVFSGVFERHPRLRIIAHHHGALVPLFATRLDASWDIFDEAGLGISTKISKPYTQHFRQFYCDTAVFGYAPKILEIALEFFGPTHVLFGSDSPMDAKNGQHFTVETLRSIEDMAISSGTRTAILSGNAESIMKV